MKSLITVILVLLSFNTFAALSEAQQEERMVDIAKKIRRGYWVSGHEEVDSSTMKVTKDFLDEHVKWETMRNFEEPLERDQVSDLYRCFYGKTCTLYWVGVSAEYWGGYGTSDHFILLNTESGKYREISHITYAE